MTPTDLTSWRKSLGLTQKAAAEALGTSQGTYENWEQGRRAIPGVVEVACRLIEDQRTAEQGVTNG